MIKLLMELGPQQVHIPLQRIVRKLLLLLDQLIDQEDNEVQELLPTDLPGIGEKTGGQPRRRRRKPGEEESGPEEEVPEGPEVVQAEEGKGGVIDIEA